MWQVDELKEQSRQLAKQKVDLENQLEAEQEYIVNKLSKQVEDLKKEKGCLQEERRGLAKERDSLNEENASLRRHVSLHLPLLPDLTSGPHQDTDSAA